MKTKNFAVIVAALIIGTSQIATAQIRALPQQKANTVDKSVIVQNQPANNTQPKPPQNGDGTGKKYYPVSAKAMESWQSGIYRARYVGSTGKGITQSFRLHENQFAITNNTNSSPSPKYFTKSNGKEEKRNSDFILDCEQRLTTVRLDDNSYLKVNVESQSEQIYPGAIYKFDDFMRGGYTSIALPRNPIVLGTTNANISGSAKEPVAEPSKTNIYNAISNMFSRFPTQTYKVRSGSFSFFAYEVFSQEDLMLKAGASGHYMGFSARNDFLYNSRESRRYFLIDMTKEMYSIFCEQPADGFLTNPSDVSNDMIYVSSVTYGMRVMAMAEVVIKNKEMSNSFHAKYDGLAYGGEINVDVFAKDAGEESTIKMYVVGGTSAKAFPAFSISQLKTRLEDLAITLNYNTSSPIKYVLSHVGLNRIIKYSTLTDQFNETSCEPRDTMPKLYQYETKITRITIDNVNENDVDLFGWATAEIFVKDENEFWVPPVRGQRHLFNIPEEHYIRKETMSNGAAYTPDLAVTHLVWQNHVPNAKLCIFFGLTDYDSGSGNDEIQVHGNPKILGPDGRNHSAVEIYLDKIEVNKPFYIPVHLVDNEGDYPFTILISITKTLAKQ